MNLCPVGLLLSVPSVSTNTTSDDTTATTAGSNDTTETTANTTTTTLVPTANESSEASTSEAPSTVEQTTQTSLPTFGPYQYQIFTETENKIDFESAQSQCVTLGGNLVSILSQEENDFVKSDVIDRYNYNGTAWIGLQQIGDSKLFSS